LSKERYLDEQVVSELRSNNESVLREIYEAHYPMVLNLILSNSGTEQEAKDIYQETILAFYDRVRTEDFALTCKVKTYLYAVSWRLWLKRLAEKKRFFGKVDEMESFLGIEEELSEIEKRELEFSRMATSLDSLGQPCRSILEDFYIKDLTLDEIAGKFGYTNADNAKNQKYKCLQRLKKLFFTNHKLKEE
jgi:RNA polymerase sigma factor (sigma-70 family)